MAGKLFNIYSGNTGGVLSTSTTKVGSFGTTSDDFYSVNFDTGRKSIWTNNIEFGRAADWGNISGIPSWIGNDGVTWADVKDKPATATRWPYWSEILSKPAAIGSATQPVYWDGSTFQLVNSVAPASHDHDDKYVKLDGTNVMSGDLTLKLADLDRFIVFSYPNAVNPSSNSWRTGVLGTGSGENNFFVVQYQRINTNSSDWNTAFKIGQDTGTVTFTNNIKVGSYTVYHSGNLPAYPTVNNGSLYLQASGTTKVTFTANQSGNSTFNIATGSTNGTISVGGTDVAVYGLGSNAYTSTAYLPLAGGTMDEGAQIKRKGKGGAWIYGRDNALIKETTSSGYHALFSMKTTDGSWELGEYNTSGWYNIPVFSYITDTNYNTGNNTATYQIKYPLASGTIALTADLTWSKIADKPATATRWPSWDEVTSKPSVFPVADHDHDSRYPRKFSYTLPSQKGVRITYSADATVLISVCGSNSGGQLVIIGTGYGEGGRIRNQFTELVSCNLFDWSIPNSNSISCSVEIFSNRDGNSTVWVISTGNITFTEINALTSTKENATLLNSSNYTSYTVKKDGTGATGTWGISITGNAGSADKLKTARTITINGSSKTFDGTGNISWSLADLNLPSNEHNHDDRYLKLTGGTLTGVLHLLGSQYADTAGTGALDLANSDIYGVNSIKFADLSDGAGEGLQWYRDATHTDSLWVKNGVIYFTPNRTWGGTGTDYTVYHTGNLTAATLLGSTAKGNSTKPIYWNGSSIVECLAYSQASVNYANSAGNADTVDSKHASDFVYTAQVSEEQNSDVNTWAQNNADTNKRSLIYNTSGTEWSYLSSLRNDGAYGAVIKFGYGNGHPAAYIKGKYSSSWYSGWVQFITSDNIGSQSVNYATSAGSATYATSAGNADTLDTFHAADLFQTFTNDAANNAVKIKIGNTEKSLVVGYATKAGDANTLDNIDSTGFLRDYHRNDDITSTEVVNTIDYIHNVGATGGASTTMTKPTGMDNAWGILHMHLHVGNYAMQLGFGGTTGHMYFRNAYNTSTFGDWVTLLDSTNSSVSKSGETLSVKINGTTQSLTNTWRGITDSYNVDSPSSSTSLSQKGAKALYSALLNGYANSAGNADTVDNYHLASWIYPTSPRDFADGTRIDTDIVYKNTNGDAFYMEIIGDTYFSLGSIYTIVQGYIYNDTIISYSVNNLGRVRLEHLYAMLIGDNLVFWFERLGYWQSYRIGVYKSSSGNYWKNHCTSITNSAKPSGTKEIDLCGNLYNNAYLDSKVSAAYNADSVPWSGITGKATSKTAWGQTFVDSSGNIQSISGNMTSVGQITPDGHATRDNGTSSANWATVYSYALRSNDNLTLRSGTSKDIIFQTNAGTEYMRLTSGGNLGIGTTTPGFKLSVSGDIYTTDNIYINTGDSDRFILFRYNSNNYAGAAWRIISRGSGSGDTNYFDIETGGSSSSATTWNRVIRLTMDNRYVGIGLDSPADKLDVAGIIRSTSSGKYLRIGCQNSSWAHYYTDASSGHYFNPGISVDGAIYIYSTNYGIRANGDIHGNGFYHRSYLDNNYVITANGSAKQWSASKTASTLVARTADNYVYAGYYNSDISNEESMTPTSVYCSNDTWIRKQSIGKFADNLRSEEIISIDKSLTITEAWMDTGIICDTTTFPRGTGTYAVQVCAAAMTSDSYYPYYSGIMTIYTSSTNSSGNDEVALHCAGHAVGTSYKRLYIRTQETETPNYNKIQIAGSANLSKAYTITFKFRKLI